jgi:hypothetical protein
MEMIRLYKKEQLERIEQKYPKEMIKEIEEIIMALDDNYGAERQETEGGYVLIAEEKDIEYIKVNLTKGLLEEYTDIIKLNKGIDYYSSLFLLGSDFSVVIFSTKEVHESLLGKEL